jgi:hypothetical protein
VPVVSEAQRRMMEARVHGHGRGKGPSKEVAKEFLAATPKGVKLPERKTRKK